MKCPYTDKVNACLYLDEMTEDDRRYECPDCPHYKPRTYMKSMDEYYNDPERESWVIAIVSLCFIAIILMGFAYIALKAIQIAMQWFQ